jgi:hypothetical protein
MSQSEHDNPPSVPVEEIQRQWAALNLKVQQLHTEQTALEAENKALRAMLETAIEHRKKSHADLISQLTNLVSKLALTDIGVIVGRLMEHNEDVAKVSVALLKGNHASDILQPAVLKALDKTKADLRAMVAPLVEELIRLDSPFKTSMLRGVTENPDLFFSPPMVRASRGFVKGQVARERIVKDFGEAALGLFKDVTTDVKFNPRPKPEEIMLAFAPDFEALLPQQTALPEAHRAELLALYHRVKASRAATPAARAQKHAFLKLSFVLELLHYYDNQQNESPDIIFAQRLPPLIEQLVIGPETEQLDEALIREAEALLAFVLHPDHRSAVINNFGKVGGLPKSLRLVLTFRPGKFTEHDPETTEFVKHLFSLKTPPDPAAFATVLKFIGPDMQKSVIRGIIQSDRLRREEALELGKAVARAVNLPDFIVAVEQGNTVLDTKRAWEQIKELIATRAGPNEIAQAIRKRLHEKYDSDEVRESWLTLAEAEPMLLVRVVCLLPYLPDGQTDPIARAVIESYANRLTHEKYAATYGKVIGALKNLFKVKADSPALVNFVALVKWVDPASADRIAKDVGMAAA